MAIRLLMLYFLLNSLWASSQVYFLPLGHAYRLEVLSAINQSDSLFIHTGWQPLNIAALQSIQDKQHIFRLKEHQDSTHRWLIRHIKYDNLLLFHQDNFTLRGDILMKFEGGKESETTEYQPLTNTRGLIFRGDIGHRFSFESRFYENQVFFPEYVRQFVRTSGVAPGQGRVRNFKIDGFDFASAAGWITFSPKHWFIFQFGNGKNFIGDGYRSLLLSDNAFTYPFTKFIVSLKRLQYTTMFTSFAGVRSYDNISIVHHKRHGSFHYLNFFPFKHWQIGLFEGIIWHTATSQFSSYYFPPTYFVPVIFLNTALYGLANNRHYILNGLNSSFELSKSIRIYGQWAIDASLNTNHKNTGYQVGGYCFNPFGINALIFQIEYNYTDSALYEPLQSSLVSHNRSGWFYYGQALAHPQGSGFAEWLVQGYYRWHDFFIKGLYSFSKNITGYDVYYRTLETGYILNHATRLQIYLGVSQRQTIWQNTSQSNYNGLFIFGGIKTNLNNYYYDF